MGKSLPIASSNRLCCLCSMPFEDAAEELYSSFSDMESIIESILFDYRTIENQADMMVRKLAHVEQSVSGLIFVVPAQYYQCL